MPTTKIFLFKLADMATKLKRAARLLIYKPTELKRNHERYGMEAAMAKQYASDVCLEIVNDALQIFENWKWISKRYGS